MRTKLFIITICLAVASMGADAAKTKTKTKAEIHTNYAAAMSGQTLSDFGEYTITRSDEPMVIKGEEFKTYELNYSNADRSVKVGVLPEKKCTNFILKTNEFEVEYVCAKGVFGVKKIRYSFQEIPKNINEAVLDKVAYYSQRVISQKPKTEGELLGLIACYYPSLIKQEYQGTF